jgi:hypothetical protein
MNKHPTKYESYRTNDLKVVAITKYNMSNNVYRGHSKEPENVSFIYRLKIGQVWLYIENAWKRKCKEKSYNSYKNCRIKMAGKYDQRPIIPPNTKATLHNTTEILMKKMVFLTPIIPSNFPSKL